MKIYGNSRDSVELTCEGTVPEYRTRDAGVTQAKQTRRCGTKYWLQLAFSGLVAVMSLIWAVVGVDRSGLKPD